MKTRQALLLTLACFVAACAATASPDVEGQDEDGRPGNEPSSDGDDGDPKAPSPNGGVTPGGNGTGGTTAGSGGKDGPSTGTKDGGAGPADGGSPTRPGPTPTPSPTSPSPTTPSPTTPASALVAKGIHIREIAIFQAVKISLYADGAVVTERKAPIVQGRPGLLRIYVKKDAQSARSARAEVTVRGDGVTPATYTATLAPKADSTDGTLSSTFNVELPGDALRPGATYSVALRPGSEADGTPAEANPDASFPIGGKPQDFGVDPSPSKLRVVIVPVRYNADGSGRVPDTSAEQLERYREATYELFPTGSLEVTSRAPMDWSAPIAGSSGKSFSDVLEALTKLRQDDVRAGRVPSDVYYYGAFNPAATFQSFCRGSCIVGLSGVATSARDRITRASVGIGYRGQELTMVHEVGHALGRRHAPCGGVSGADPSFPYAGGAIGVWGYSLFSKKLYSPSQSKDFMGYCSPNWVSDFNFKALFERISAVTEAGLVVSEPNLAPYRFLHVDGRGGGHWGGTFVPDETPSSAPGSVVYLDANGAEIGRSTAAFYPYSDTDGGYFLVPEGAPATAVRARATMPDSGATTELPIAGLVTERDRR